MTRRLFVQSLSATALGIAGLRARAISKRSTASDADRWTAARLIVESGALGTVIWGQMSEADGLAGDRELNELMTAMGVSDRPYRVTRLRGASPTTVGSTTIVEFAAGPPVYLAPGVAVEATIRGTRALLRLRGNQLRVVPCTA